MYHELWFLSGDVFVQTDRLEDSRQCRIGGLDRVDQALNHFHPRCLLLLILILVRFGSPTFGGVLLLFTDAFNVSFILFSTAITYILRQRRYRDRLRHAGVEIYWLEVFAAVHTRETSCAATLKWMLLYLVLFQRCPAAVAREENHCKCQASFEKKN